MGVILIGMMGSGKTTVGRLLASRVGGNFADLDDLVEERAEMSVREIFETQGEAKFRALEREALSSVRLDERSVLAAGGGTPCNSVNLVQMRKMAPLAYLRVPVNLLVERLADAPSVRPKLDSGIEAAIRELLKEREEIYETADFVVDASASPSIVVEDLRGRLGW